MRIKKRRQGRMNLLTLCLVAAVSTGVGASVLYGPYYWDYLVMREVTQAAALEWYNIESLEAGKKRLRRELVKNDIPTYIDETHCVFDTDVEGDGRDVLVVSCAWSAYVYYPFSDEYRQLDFSATTEVNSNRDINTF